MLNTNHEATKAAKFRNKSSRVLLDGREILGRLDYADRKREIFERSGGRCEFINKPMAPFKAWRCGRAISWDGFDPHHVIPRGSNGVDRDDRASNLLAICRECHSKLHVRVMWTQKTA